MDDALGEACDDDDRSAAFRRSSRTRRVRPTLLPRRWRRLPVVLGLEGQEARILELILAMARRIRRRPLAAWPIGAAAGFVIGGALSFRVGRILLAAGARHVARELLKQLL